MQFAGTRAQPAVDRLRQEHKDGEDLRRPQEVHSEDHVRRAGQTGYMAAQQQSRRGQCVVFQYGPAGGSAQREYE